MKYILLVHIHISLLFISGCTSNSNLIQLIEARDYSSLSKVCNSKPHLITSYQERNATPYLAAIKKKDDKAIQILITHTHNSLIPMEQAALELYLIHEGNIKLLKLALDNAKMRFALGKSGFSTSENKPLIADAIYSKKPGKVIEFLVSRKAILLDGYSEERFSQEYPPPVLWAAREGQWEALLALVKHGANINISSKGKADLENGQTSLMLAAKAGNSQVVRKLLESGADKTAKDKKGQSALDYAIENSKKEEDPFGEEDGKADFEETIKLLKQN